MAKPGGEKLSDSLRWVDVFVAPPTQHCPQDRWRETLCQLTLYHNAADTVVAVEGMLGDSTEMLAEAAVVAVTARVAAFAGQVARIG